MSEPTIDLNFRLDGRVALVTGGASGIGAAIAAAFAAKGARIAVVDLNESGALDAAVALGDDSRGFRCDVTDPESVTATVDAVAKTLDRIDILVNIAGIVMLAPAEELSLDAWDATIDVNLKGTFLMCQTVGNRMLAAERGAIITWPHRPRPSRWISTWPTAPPNSAWSACPRSLRPSGPAAECGSTPSHPRWCSPNSGTRHGTGRQVTRSRSSSPPAASRTLTRSPLRQSFSHPPPPQ